MTHLELLEKAERIKELINRRNTGNPRELAQRLNLSERSLSRLIKTLKENDNPINYDRTRKSYIID